MSINFPSKQKHKQSEAVHVSLEQHSSKRNHQGENEVNIDHLDVGGWWQTVAYLKSCDIYINLSIKFIKAKPCLLFQLKTERRTLTLINKVVRTSIAVRFTVTEASKKNGLKKFVE